MAALEKQIGIGQPQEAFKRLGGSALNFLGTNPLTRAVIKGTAPFLLDAGTEVTSFNFRGLDQIGEYLKPNTLLVVTSNHQSHADVVVILNVVSELRRRFPQLGNFYIPISETLENGVQSGISRTIYHEIGLPEFRQQKIEPVYVITENDVKKRGVVMTREMALAQVEKIKEPVKEEASAYFVLPEGTVEAGRHNADGSIKGMQNVRNPFLRSIFDAALENNREIVVLPVGVDRTYRLLSGEHIFLTQDSFKALMRRILRRKIVNLAEVVVGSPFIVPPDINPRTLNDLVMRQHIAPLVPEVAQGYYRNGNPQESMAA